MLVYMGYELDAKQHVVQMSLDRSSAQGTGYRSRKNDIIHKHMQYFYIKSLACVLSQH